MPRVTDVPVRIRSRSADGGSIYEIQKQSAVQGFTRPRRM
jgi:hypothetical protein